jgi:uncharacterized protein (TIGR00251 family)
MASFPDTAVHWDGKALVLRIYAQPGAKKTQVEGLHGGRIKIRLAAPPVEGRANECLREFLAEQFGVAKSRVTLLRGESGRSKDVRIENPATVPEWLTSA